MPNPITVKDGVVRILLAKGREALVSEDDYPLVKGFRWYAQKADKTYYVNASTPLVNGKRTNISIHRLLCSDPKGYEVDHINHNPLDNRRENLRVVTHRENILSRGLFRKNKTGVVGVRWNDQRLKWTPHINVDGKNIYLGAFICFKKAVEEREKAVEKICKDRKWRIK